MKIIYNDKIKHFILSSGIVIVGAYFSVMLLGVICAIIAGYYKDFVLDSKADWYDILADILGILVGIVICLVK